MSIRQQLEAHEKTWLSSKASFSAATKGRDKPIRPCDLRTEFQRDRDRITYSRAFSRLRRKLRC
jgi:dGTPase